jgi:hypothetical protein
LISPVIDVELPAEIILVCEYNLTDLNHGSSFSPSEEETLADHPFGSASQRHPVENFKEKN